MYVDYVDDDDTNLDDMLEARAERRRRLALDRLNPFDPQQEPLPEDELDEPDDDEDELYRDVGGEA